MVMKVTSAREEANQVRRFQVIVVAICIPVPPATAAPFQVIMIERAQ